MAMKFVFAFALFNLIIALSNQEITDRHPQLVQLHECTLEHILFVTGIF